MLALIILLTTRGAVALPTDPCAHRIFFVPQTHETQGKNYEDLTPEQRTKAAQSQLAIVQFLDRFPQMPVFSEQMTSEDIDSTTLPAKEKARLARLASGAFPKGFDIDLAQLTERQKKMLVDNGADTVQLMRGRLPIIHRVVKDKATDDRLFGTVLPWIAAHPNAPYPPEIARQVYGEREREALRQVDDFFAANPTVRNAAILFGSNHNFSFYADLFPPQCIIVPLEFQADWVGQYRVGPEGFSPEAMRTGVIKSGGASR